MVSFARGCPLLRASCSTRHAAYTQSSSQAIWKCSSVSRSVARFSSRPVPEFGFAFDIDGVLLRSSKALPGATKALITLQNQNIPYILLTNGGGQLERDRVKQLSRQLLVGINPHTFIQSHTPYEALETQVKEETILVIGGTGEKCREAAKAYGFKSVVIPSDIFHAHPEIWPFSSPFAEVHAKAAQPLPLPLFVPTETEPTPVNGKHLRIHSMFVYNDPRDMGLDTQLVIDLLLSHEGYLGTISDLNGRSDLPNYGYQQDSQPTLYFANPDLFWAAKYHLPRLGSGGFQASIRGLWNEVSGRQGISLTAVNGGKPHAPTYEYAEQKIVSRWGSMFGDDQNGSYELSAMDYGLKRIYMVGDNPASDITGANSFQGPEGRKWLPILVRSGVWRGEQPKKSVEKPYRIVDGVYDAVESVLREEGWSSS